MKARDQNENHEKEREEKKSDRNETKTKKWYLEEARTIGSLYIGFVFVETLICR